MAEAEFPRHWQASLWHGLPGFPPSVLEQVLQLPEPVLAEIVNQVSCPVLCFGGSFCENVREERPNLVCHHVRNACSQRE